MIAQQGQTWQELLDSIARRMREPDMASVPTTSEEQTPYFAIDEVERLLYRVSLTRLRAMSEQELDAVGPAALAALDGSFNVPTNAYGVAAAAIQTVIGGLFAPAEFVAPAIYYEMMTVPDAASAIYTFIDRHVFFKGYHMQITYRVEPTLTQFRNDEVTLPAEHNEDQIDTVHKLMLGQDFMPTGRM